MTTPTPLREALATAWRHHRRGYFHLGVPHECSQVCADAILAHPSMQAVAEHERTDSALDLQTERDLAEAYYPTLERHLREHGCDHDFAEVANANGVLGGDSKDLNAERAEYEAVGRAVARLLAAMSRFDRHGFWTGAMPTITPTYGGGWSVTIEYPEADYGNHLGFGSGDTLGEAVDAALAEAEATVAAEAIVAALGPPEGERT